MAAPRQRDEWQRLCSGSRGGGNVYAGGAFTTAGGTEAINVAKWDGSHWSALGSGTNDAIYALAMDRSGNAVYAGGRFTTAGGTSANRIAKWNDTTSDVGRAWAPAWMAPVYALG